MWPLITTVSKYSMHKVSVAMNMKLQICVQYKCKTEHIHAKR